MEPYTLKNKGASRCNRITFLSKWFHKEPLTSEEHLCLKKKVLCGERRFLKEPLTECFFVEPKISTLIFKSV